tara:strand:+ start:278 stop:718 length:441 start_codon:yes stop_codon:yes gene_type:complete
MYKPLPKQLTVKQSPIEGLGLYATQDIKKDSFVGVTHVRDEQFENKYIRTPVGGFYNHSNEPNVVRMVSDTLPKLKFGDNVNSKKNIREEQDKKESLEDVFYDLQEKSDAKYMFLITLRDIKAGEELTANYNLYTYPKTGIGIQSF